MGAPKETKGHPESGPALGTTRGDARGIKVVTFSDSHKRSCTIQPSSAGTSDSRDAGTSFLWIGVDDPKPEILARDAASHGIRTNKRVGWVPFPVPEGVHISTRMHLDREQVRGLVRRLEEWLDTGDFSP